MKKYFLIDVQNAISTPRMVIIGLKNRNKVIKTVIPTFKLDFRLFLAIFEKNYLIKFF